MARAKYFFELLAQGVKVAETESEKKALINHFADFCVDTGIYFDSPVYFDFERAVEESIDCANAINYRYEVFDEQYLRTVTLFFKLKEWYDSLFDGLLFSYPIIATDPDKLEAALRDLFFYPRSDTEALVMDCAGSKEATKKIKAIIAEHAGQNIKYVKPVSDNAAENQLALLEKCKGMFVFPMKEHHLYMDPSYPIMLTIMLDNPQAGCIFAPAPGSRELTTLKDYEVIVPGNERINSIMEDISQVNFGYRRSFINFKSLKSLTYTSEDAIFKTIAASLSEAHESVFFNLPYFALTNNSNISIEVNLEPAE